MKDNVPIIELKNVSKTFGGVVRALDSVSIAIYKNEVVGVVGENGAGKSTLMKILAGVFPPDSGEWYYTGQKLTFPKNPKEAVERGVAIVYQEKGVVPALKVYQYLFLGHEDKYSEFFRLKTNEMKKYADEMLKEFHIDCDIENFMYELSPSTQKMIEIAKAILSLRLEYGSDNTASVVILDEPTAPLTVEERQDLFNYILKMKKATSFVLVSHIMHEVLEFTDRVYVLRDGKLVAHYNLSEDKITENDLFKAIVGKEFVEELHATQTGRNVGDEVVLVAKNLTKKGSYYDVSFELRKGECIGIFGPAGSGKSEIIKTIAGILHFDKGVLAVKGEEAKSGELPHVRLTKGVGYFCGRTEEQLFFNWSVRKNISIVNMEKILRKPLPVINFNTEKQVTEKIMQKFRIKTPSVDTDCQSLSGGNKQKLSVGRWFERRPDILLLEDPTIGIDVGAREDIYEAVLEMKNEGVSMVLVSDDPKEYSTLCDKIIFMKSGRVEKVLNALEFKEAIVT
ncbi:MAG: ribose transport system ATP-binding protein [Candidatus Atribacteria bacterium]|nr:ribose transport system ATP-binding protein [Candidatus Atribacteria bacterium]